MDSIAVNELKRPREVRERLAAAEEMSLTGNGRPMAVIMYVDAEDDPEDVLKAAREARSRITLRRIRERTHRSGAATMPSEAPAERAGKGGLPGTGLDQPFNHEPDRVRQDLVSPGREVGAVGEEFRLEPAVGLEEAVLCPYFVAGTFYEGNEKAGFGRKR